MATYLNFWCENRLLVFKSLANFISKPWFSSIFVVLFQRLLNSVSDSFLFPHGIPYYGHFSDHARVSFLYLSLNLFYMIGVNNVRSNWLWSVILLDGRTIPRWSWTRNFNFKPSNSICNSDPSVGIFSILRSTS